MHSNFVKSKKKPHVKDSTVIAPLERVTVMVSPTAAVVLSTVKLTFVAPPAANVTVPSVVKTIIKLRITARILFIRKNPPMCFFLIKTADYFCDVAGEHGKVICCYAAVFCNVATGKSCCICNDRDFGNMTGKRR